MSWSVTGNYLNSNAAKKTLDEQKTWSQEQPWGLPVEAKAIILTAIELCGLAPDEPLKLQAYGHSPRGNFRVEVEPLFIVGLSKSP